MSNFDWAIFVVVAIAALTQLYFGAKYRDVFVVSSSTINKSYISQIRDFKQKHPAAGKIYIVLVTVQLFGFAAIVATSHFG